MAKQIVEMTVTEVTQEPGDTKNFRLEWPAGVDYEFRTGQFITVYLPEDPKTKRAYSLSSCSLDRGFFEITVKRAGHFGTRLNEVIQPGSTLMVIAPVGKFTMPEDRTMDLVMIAGGSGVTPFRGFIREINRCGYPTHATILYSVRNPGEVIFDAEFRQLAAQNPNFKFKVTCTRATAEQGYTGPEWTGHRGRINAEWIREQIRDLGRTVFYACGPTDLVNATEHLVVHELGVPKEQMRTEKWG
ncbi:MAG: FAD-binding oxidoreductase [Verrucomicrobiae bacterium]|nr:FAD-binding oxidoreductase [Verrucomicrobiae bacterium]